MWKHTTLWIELIDNCLRICEDKNVGINSHDYYAYYYIKIIILEYFTNKKWNSWMESVWTNYIVCDHDTVGDNMFTDESKVAGQVKKHFNNLNKWKAS